MAQKPVRMGIVGAGANTRSRHIPGFRAMDGVTITCVANRTLESSQKAATELGIPKAHADWRAVVESSDVDAVMIGTWPNTHCEITLAALAAGKHVLTEARMACDLAEARKMLAAAQAHPKQISMVVPSPFGLTVDPAIQYLISHNFLGHIRELVVISADNTFWDYSKPLHWRQDANISGKNILTMGIMHETLLRWAPPPTRVFAQTAVLEPTRPIPAEGRIAPVTVPDSVQIVTHLEGGGRGMYHFSGIAMHGPGKQIYLYGSRGTVRVDFGEKETVFVGPMDYPELKPAEIPAEQLSHWRVEEEFINAIRGIEPVKLNDFATAVKYMEFTEAVALSAERDVPIHLPLPIA